MSGLRLNLGCGHKRFDGYINVDRFGEPDLRHDLESIPWPWPDDSVSEIIMEHVLEHLGRDPTVYLDIWKEMYRVCRDGATIRIVVPHHRHEFFYNDPTHVRAVTADGLALFSQRLNRQFAAQGMSNTPLGLYLGIDFEVVDVKLKPTDSWQTLHAQNPAAAQALWQQNALYNNIIEQVDMVLRAVKPPGREAG
jgi:hypothetical protein